jgi:F0F1-type ATP synthase assembly protein I
MILGVFGPWQLIVVLVIPVGIFLAGFFIGRNVGYLRRVREMENKN